MEEKEKSIASDKPKENSSTVAPSINDDFYNSAKEHTEDINAKDKNDTPQQIFPSKNEWYKRWKRSEIISSVGIILSTIAIFMTVKSFDKTSESVKISQNTFEHNRVKDSIAEDRQDRKDSIDKVRAIIVNSIDSAERKFNRDYISASLNVAKQNADAIAKTAATSDKAFNETRNSNNFNKQAAEKELRAYIALNSPVMVNFKKDSSFYTQYWIVNTGKTPAYNFKCISRFTFTETLEEVELGDIEGGLENAKKITLPSLQSNFLVSDPYTPKHSDFIDIVNRGLRKIFIIIYCEYEDVFNKKRTIQAMYEYHPENGLFYIAKKFNSSN